jgi:hypothetical protein
MLEKLAARLRPNPVSILLFLLIVGTSAVLFGSTSASEQVAAHGQTTLTSTTESFWLFGVELTRDSAGGVQFSAHWLQLFSVLALVYIATAIVGSLFRGGALAVRAVRSMIYAVAASIALSVVAGAVIDKVYWDYYFSRPGIDPTVFEIDRVETVTPFSSEKYGPLVIDRHETAGSVSEYTSDVDSLPFQRIPHALKQRGLLPNPLQYVPPERLQKTWQFAQSHTDLYGSSHGYDWRDWSNGVMIEGSLASGSRLAVLAIRGGEVSNDHYPYYEFLLSQNADGSPGRLLSTKRFYFDVAGMEGMAWYGIALALTVLSAPLFMALALATLFLRNARRAKRA